MSAVHLTFVFLFCRSKIELRDWDRMEPPPQPPPFDAHELEQFAAVRNAAANQEDIGSIRMYGIQARVEDMMREMSKEELLGAHMVLSVLSARLGKIWFEDRIPFDRKALVKTIEELFEISCEIKYHKFPDTPSPSSPSAIHDHNQGS